jgi:hypothetical protein
MGFDFELSFHRATCHDRRRRRRDKKEVTQCRSTLLAPVRSPYYLTTIIILSGKELILL